MNSPALRILLVEDHPDVASTFAAMLRQEGHAVRVARNIKSARALAQAERFDLLLCDVRLADGDGCELMQLLSSDQPIRGIAIGSGDEEEAKRCDAAGFIMRIGKPFVMETLWSAIDAVTFEVGREKAKAAAAAMEALSLNEMLDADVQFT